VFTEGNIFGGSGEGILVERIDADKVIGGSIYSLISKFALSASLFSSIVGNFEFISSIRGGNVEGRGTERGVQLFANSIVIFGESIFTRETFIVGFIENITIVIVVGG